MTYNALATMRFADFGQAAQRGINMAATAGALQDRNALRAVYAEHGPGIAAGHPNALNALAGVDPMAALDVRRTQQVMRLTEDDARRARDEIAVKTVELSRGLLREELHQDAMRLDNAVAYFKQGDMEGALQVLAQVDAEAARAFAGPWERNQDWQVALGAALEGVRRGAYTALGERDPATMQAAPDTEAEREIARLLELGMSRPEAIALKEGVLRLQSDPITGEAQLVNMQTGQLRALGGSAGPAQTQGSSIQGVSPPMEPSQVPGNAASAFGARGMLNRGVNAVSDFATGRELLPAVGEHQRFFRDLEESLLVPMAQAYGRQPAQALMERLRKLMPQAGTAEGASTALGELQQLKRRFERDQQLATDRLARRMRPNQRGEIEGQLQGIEQALSLVDEAIARFGAQGTSGSGQTRSGINWSIEQ